MIRFTKMQGIGNDYIYVNGYEYAPGTGALADPADLATRIADRHFGVGADGLILILPPEEGVAADVRMRMFNADGSESEMCGNGVRCVCKFAYDHSISRAKPMRIQTGAGVLAIDYALDQSGKVREATVDMGEPILDLDRVPVDRSQLLETDSGGNVHTLEAKGVQFKATFVSMGNPHAVIYAQDIAAVNLPIVGPVLERHPAFPKRMNIHFVHVHSSGEVTMRTWERGSGITLACGTGASAVCVAGAVTGVTGRNLLAHLPGGDLSLRWDKANNRVYMTGPAEEIFSGEWPE